ncbi:MmgE/PrpD family protein [Rhodococcus opacus]|uniref:MmgE/PrpD family protein n=1 Tax=Rhodococcus opacus TaxID=37919 RepID=UPI001C441B0F|nr:MmgE/PrpD family protein [Rhodococcus opacus]MBV6760344.1 MmgE/PrpD family protein [Rhodococcus opacus]
MPAPTGKIAVGCDPTRPVAVRSGPTASTDGTQRGVRPPDGVAIDIVTTKIRKRMLKQHEVAADTLVGSAAYALASYATATQYETLPGEVADRAKLIVFDQLACGFVGAELPAGRIIGRYVADMGGKPQSVVLGSPDRSSAPLAALANGTSGHADEFDSVHATSDFLGTGHPAAIIVPAAAALAERQFCTGRDLVNAVTLGYDVGARVISVTGGLAPMMGNHGIDPGSLHSLGAAFACARLLGLDESRHLFAAALAVQQSVALNAPYGERRHMSKAFVTGQAAYAGVTGAVLAAAGFEASDNIFEARAGSSTPGQNRAVRDSWRRISASTMR